MQVTSDSPILVPDAGPLITLAYADALDLLLLPGWPLRMVDMVLREVTRNQTPTSQKISRWVAGQGLTVHETRVFQRYSDALARGESLRKAHLGELAVQEVMTDFALLPSPQTGIFLFEDHKIARPSFAVLDSCHKISTRAFLLFLEQKGWQASAAQVERQAILAGRAFSRLRFPLV